MSLPSHKHVALQPSGEPLELLTCLSGQRAQRANIILGMLRHNCRFHGICRVDPPGVTASSPVPLCHGESVAGWLLRPKPGYCVLLIESGQLGGDEEQYHFARPSMEIGHSLDVSAFYGVGGGKKYWLGAGAYRLRKLKGHYAIRLPIYALPPC